MMSTVGPRPLARAAREGCCCSTPGSTARRRVVEDEDARLANERPRDRDALALAPGQVHAPLLEHGVETACRRPGGGPRRRRATAARLSAPHTSSSVKASPSVTLSRTVSAEDERRLRARARRDSRARRLVAMSMPSRSRAPDADARAARQPARRCSCPTPSLRRAR